MIALQLTGRGGSSTASRDQRFYAQFLTGLTVAGVASCLLVTTFGLFHVDVFLRVYQLPLTTYSGGNIIFAIINTVNDFVGAWFLDNVASGLIHRSDLIGISGVLFSICFLSPFFRWATPSKWDGFHFVATTSLYDTLYSFTTILLGSLVTDNHHMSDSERVWFMASGRMANLLAAFAVGRIGLALFDEHDLRKFRAFLWALSIVSAVLFVTAQIMTRYVIDWQVFQLRRIQKPESLERRNVSRRNLNMRQVLADFWSHSNFWAWIGMEFLLESQVSFATAFLKTFVDRLVHEEGVSRETCDWLLSTIRPLGLIAGILCYVPIRKMGYRRLYPILFYINFGLSIIMYFFGNHQSTFLITLFLVIYPTITVAVSSSGFHLAMSDMVLEMKNKHALAGRTDEPSLAALYMGMNALFCKPAEAMLPIVAANMLDKMDLQAEDNQDVQLVLFKMLVIPPLVFSVFEWLSWRRFSLTPDATHDMREELKKLHRIESASSDTLHEK
eukprot:Nitzschia sp. Nitz4//scaffold426_size8320//5308//6807//NITZ4_009128-RA/size8320-processed-gene-0.4-mRNA-1//1//CDS//3329551618//5777//frame0